MKLRRVLILYENSLLAEGLRALLSQESRLEVRAEKLAGCSSHDPEDPFVPDVIIVDRDELAGQTEVTIGDLLSGKRDTRVIDVSVRTPKVRLYQAHEFSEVDLQHLLAAIDSDNDALIEGESVQPATTPKARRTSKGGA